MSLRHLCLVWTACLGIASCGALADPEIVNGDADQVTIKAGTHMNPAALAEVYCRDHGKTPVLTNVEDPEFYGPESMFFFDCR